MLVANKILQGRYIILQALARGGMGAVYLAKDQRLGNTVALKETLFTDEVMRKAFEQEAQLLASLRHFALPRVIDHFVEADGQFLVMEYIPGDDLMAMLKARMRREFPLDQVMEWADQLLGTLEYLHSRRPPVIHRDIKPANLKMNDEGQIILLDFGLAKGTTSTSIPGFTPSYAPLEQVDGSGTDARSDLYSVAATMYHLVTGQAPPDAITRAAALYNGNQDPLRPAAEVNSNVPASVSEILHRCLSQNAKDRPSSASLLRNELRAAAQKLVVTAPDAETVPALSKVILVEPWGHRYEGSKLIAETSSCQTYLATFKKTKEMVCITRLRTTTSGPIVRLTFGALVRMNHPGIARVFDFSTQTSPYFVTEFSQAPTLQDYLRIHQPLGESLALALAHKLFDALAYVHEKSFFHGNLNPFTIRLDLHGTKLLPRITDLGIAILTRNEERSVRVHEPLEYLAPEQCNGVDATEKSDVYALGQIVWEMITGRPAFVGEPETIIQEKNSLQRGLQIWGDVPGISNSVAELVMDCTRLEPEERPKARDVCTILNTLVPQVSFPCVMGPLNLGFDLPIDGGLPPGWFNGLGFVDNVSTAYDVEIVDSDRSPGRSLHLKSEDTGKNDFGVLMQRFPASHLTGKNVRLEGDIKTSQLSNWAGLWLRGDVGLRTLFFYNMHDQPIKGSTGWTTYSIEAKVQPMTDWINFGVLLAGCGEIWADNFRFLVKDSRGVFRRFALWNDSGYKKN